MTDVPHFSKVVDRYLLGPAAVARACDQVDQVTQAKCQTIASSAGPERIDRAFAEAQRLVGYYQMAFETALAFVSPGAAGGLVLAQLQDAYTAVTDGEITKGDVAILVAGILAIGAAGYGVSRVVRPGAPPIVGPYGSVGSDVLERASASGGPTTRIVTSLDGAPAGGRALSVATGDSAEGVARAAGGASLYHAEVPTALIAELERVGLATRKRVTMNGATGTEIRFRPGAAEYIIPFFGGQ